MSETTRRFHSAEAKIAALKRHLLDKIPVSQICDELQISVNTFYLWQRELFENGHLAFGRNRRDERRTTAMEKQKVEVLEAKLQRKDSVIAELMEEHVQMKKSLGEP